MAEAALAAGDRKGARGLARQAAAIDRDRAARGFASEHDRQAIVAAAKRLLAR